MVSIIIPIIRPEKAERCIKMVHENCGVTDYEIISEEDTERIGCPKMVKKLVGKAKGEYICFIGDDCEPRQDFLKNALMCMWDNLPGQWGLVGLNDETGRDLPTHWLAHANMLDHLENREFFYTGYTHCYCDMELRDRAESLNRYTYCKGAVVKHDHPALTGSPTNDPDYIRVYSDKVKGKDRDLYYSRKTGTPVRTAEIQCPACNKNIEICMDANLFKGTNYEL